MLEELVATNVYGYGAEVCEVSIFRDRLGAQTAYVAVAYVQEDDGRALRAVGGADGEPITQNSANPIVVLEAMRRYLESRFGPHEPRPDAVVDPAFDSRPILDPPLRDSRRRRH